MALLPDPPVGKQMANNAWGWYDAHLYWNCDPHPSAAHDAYLEYQALYDEFVRQARPFRCNKRRIPTFAKAFDGSRICLVPVACDMERLKERERATINDPARRALLKTEHDAVIADITRQHVARWVALEQLMDALCHCDYIQDQVGHALRIEKQFEPIDHLVATRYHSVLMHFIMQPTR